MRDFPPSPLSCVPPPPLLEIASVCEHSGRFCVKPTTCLRACNYSKDTRGVELFLFEGRVSRYFWCRRGSSVITRDHSTRGIYCADFNRRLCAELNCIAYSQRFRRKIVHRQSSISASSATGNIQYAVMYSSRNHFTLLFPSINRRLCFNDGRFIGRIVRRNQAAFLETHTLLHS